MKGGLSFRKDPRPANVSAIANVGQGADKRFVATRVRQEDLVMFAGHVRAVLIQIGVTCIRRKSDDCRSTRKRRKQRECSATGSVRCWRAACVSLPVQKRGTGGLTPLRSPDSYLAARIRANTKSHFRFSSRRFAHTVTVGRARVVGNDEFGEQAEGQGLAAEE